MSRWLFATGLALPVVWVTFRLPPAGLIVGTLLLWGLAWIVEKIEKRKNVA